MAKRNPPTAGYWISCPVDYDMVKQEPIMCNKSIHDVDCKCSLFLTDGTLKNMKYVHCDWGTEWNKLTWTCFPFSEMNSGKLQYFATLADLKAALGNHRFNNII